MANSDEEPLAPVSMTRVDRLMLGDLLDRFMREGNYVRNAGGGLIIDGSVAMNPTEAALLERLYGLTDD